MANNIHQPKFRVYVTTGAQVNVDDMKQFIQKSLGAKDVTTSKSNVENHINLTVNASKLSNTYRYLQKKRGIKNVRINI
jgi:hypothetical protein